MGLGQNVAPGGLDERRDDSAGQGSPWRIHVGFEVMLYSAGPRPPPGHGDGLRESVEGAAGDFIFIEPACRAVFNLSNAEPSSPPARTRASGENHSIREHGSGKLVNW